MAKFVYIGGTTLSEHVSEAFGNERSGVKMPASTTAFGIEFIVNQPVDVSRDRFKTEAAHRHALAKFATNQFFKPVADEAEFTMVEPEKVDVGAGGASQVARGGYHRKAGQ